MTHQRQHIEIIVLVYTKLGNSQRKKKKNVIWSKLGWKGDYSRARPLCFYKPVDITGYSSAKMDIH